jgi:hypothetical protein
MVETTHVLYVAPYFTGNILRCLDALCALPRVRAGIISQEPEERLPASFRGRIAGHYRVADCLDHEAITLAGRAFQKEWGGVDRLLGFLEQMQLPLAIARDRLGIPGMGEAVARNFREKNRMKQTLRAAGLPVAAQALLTSGDEARRFVADVGYPIVLKPPAGLGSRGTVRVTDDEELAQALEDLLVSPSNPAQAEAFVRGRSTQYCIHSFSRTCSGPGR